MNLRNSDWEISKINYHSVLIFLSILVLMLTFIVPGIFSQDGRVFHLNPNPLKSYQGDTVRYLYENYRTKRVPYEITVGKFVETFNPPIKSFRIVYGMKNNIGALYMSLQPLEVIEKYPDKAHPERRKYELQISFEGSESEKVYNIFQRIPDLRNQHGQIPWKEEYWNLIKSVTIKFVSYPAASAIERREIKM